MQQRPTRSDLFKLGGLAALVGGALGIILNLLHPRSTDNVGSVRGHLEMIANSDLWRLIHVGLGLAVALGLIGVIAIALSMAGSPGEEWARTWLIFTAASSAVLLVLLAIDGTAMKAMADGWLDGGKDAGAFAAAHAVEVISTALFGAGTALYFGVAPLLFGMAVFATGVYPKALGQAAMAAGGLGLLTSLLMAIQGVTTLNSVFLFPVASLLGTIVLMWAGWELWKGQASAGLTRSTTVTKTETPVTPGL
jgi:hypothetical protein